MSCVKYKNLCEILDFRNTNLPDVIAYRFLEDGIHAKTLTSKELYLEVNKLANLISGYIKPQDRVILAAKPGLEYIIGFFACLRAGAIAVPVFPPANTQMAFRLFHIIQDANPSLMLCDKTTTGALKKGIIANRFLPSKFKRMAGLNETYINLFDMLRKAHIPLVSTEQRKKYPAQLARANHRSPQDIAFLQYTSGSTGNPKGVILTHGNLLNNVEIIKTAMSHTEDSHVFSWLPPYHDLGLIGCIMEPLYANITATHMSPVDFIKKPFLWMINVSKYQCTTIAAPNFAFDLCARKTEDAVVKELDLTCLDTVVNGAEPISIQTMDLFYEKFKSAGYRKKTLHPCYGLAEATLMVSSKLFLLEAKVINVDPYHFGKNKITVTADSSAGVSLVSCGIPRTNVKIIHPKAHTLCQEDEVGEIWVQGASIGQGYYNNEAETRKTFKNQIKDYEDNQYYLKTGDLGFIHQGELFVCGRIKDLIIINGQNYYPHDFEFAAMSANPHIQKGCVIAFSEKTAVTEQLVLVADLKKNTPAEAYPEIVADMQKAISSGFNLTANAIYLTPPKTIPKTTSGKLQRKKCAELIENNQIKYLYCHRAPITEVGAADQKENWLLEVLKERPDNRKTLLISHVKELIANVLNVPDSTVINANSNFFELGLDSLMLTDLVSRLNERLGPSAEISLKVLMEYHTPNLLGKYLNKEMAPLQVTEIQRISSQILSNKVFNLDKKIYPITHQQLNFYLSDKLAPNKGAYNVSLAFKLNFSFDAKKIQRALLNVVNTHPILQSHFEIKESQILSSEFSELFPEAFYTKIKAQNKNLNHILDENALVPFNLEKGPLFRVNLIESNDEWLMQLIFHHTICDGISLKIFIEHFLAFYHEKNIQQSLPYSEYSKWLGSYNQSVEYKTAVEYWKNLISTANLRSYLTKNVNLEIACTSETIEEDTINNIKSFCGINSISLQNFFLFIYYLVLSKKLDTLKLNIGTLFSGRNSSDWNKTLGVFVNLLPVVFNYDNYPNVLTGIKALQNQIVESIEFSDYNIHDLAPQLSSQKIEAFFEFIFVYQLFLDEKNKDQKIDIIYKNNGLGLDPFVFEVRHGSKIELLVKYNTNLFSSTDIKKFVKEVKSLSEAIVNNNLLDTEQLSVSKFEYLISEPEEKRISLVSTFTIEPIISFMEYWFKQINTTYCLEVGEYNQVIQCFLNNQSILYKNKNNFVFISLYDWFKDENKIDQSIIKDLINAIEYYVSSSSNLVFLFFTPPPPNREKSNNFIKTESQIKLHFSNVPSIYIKTHNELLNCYHIHSYFDEITYRQGGIPYNDELFMALATYAVRQLDSLRRNPKKVIILDCDNTLWKGVVGEDGIQGIQINQNHIQLQSKVKELKDQGFLLALCSKNILEDVKAVFEQRDDMILSWDDILSTKINWDNKASNLHQLAKELNLGLDSFIFIDDNLLECAEIEALCPGIEVIPFPYEENDVAVFLDNIWSFDRPKTTKEDVHRADFYKQNEHRENLQQSTKSLDEFIQQLNLQVDIKPATEMDVPRVSQLSMRTNQFNTTSIRYDESQIFGFIKKDCFEVYTVTVSDKFGDYGLVGVLIVNFEDKKLIVDSMLLSCRALGRGVEKIMYQKLIDLCWAKKIEKIEFKFKKTERNIPAEFFLKSIYTEINHEGYVVCLKQV
ncbi:HAD-IIIC family phosphatase [Legionella cardiaca]|uniref:HAD-IIIC family phosphatase n=1 Tax=Legionella cardiaca TaxID=1071983 RepID=A0ABY8AQT4_9GAMM|nr:HAD-IIIC family phosphatase [Legionella cardiaca]WED42136.1 HAD-IIIC family phosphatase [Legionella cardiaca]